MKVKYLIPSILLLMLALMTSCTKERRPKPSACSDTVPKSEMCQAVFNRWFFDKNKNKCTQVAYSGCSAKGFATEKECEDCKCK